MQARPDALGVLVDGLRARHVHQRQLRRREVGLDAVPQAVHLFGGHHAIGERQQNDCDAVVVRCAEVLRRRGRLAGMSRLEAGTKVPQHTLHVPVPPEREHVRDVIAQCRTSCGDHGQAAREADAHQANLAIGRQRWLPRQPQPRVLDLVHRIEEKR